MTTVGRRVAAVIVAVLAVTSIVAMPLLADGTDRTGIDRASAFDVNGEERSGIIDGAPAHTRSLAGAEKIDGERETAKSTDGLEYPKYFENVTTDDLESLTPLEQRVWSMYRIEAIDPIDEKERRDRITALETMNAILSSHVDWLRVERSDVFEQDREVLRNLRTVEDEEIVDEVGVALASADGELAHRAVEDAEYVFDAYGDEIESRGQWTKAVRQIENANRALERGDDRFDPGTGDLQQHRSAIKQYERAWSHAQKSIETVNEQVGPSLSVTADEHIPHEETIGFPISGTISAPSATIEAVDIYVDGTYHETVSVDWSTAPSIPEDFDTTVELDRTEATIEVIAEDGDTGQHVAETVAVSAPGFADETYTITETEQESEVAVSVTGEGILGSDIQVSHVPPETERSFHAGPFVHVRNFSAFDTATIEIPIAEDVDLTDVDPNGGDLAVFKWDPHDDQPWHSIPTEIDATNGTAIAEVDSFSYVSVFWTEEWREVTRRTIELEERHLQPGNGTGGEGGEFEYTLTVTDSNGNVVGSTTVIDDHDLEAYGNHLTFTTIGDTTWDGDHAFVDDIRYGNGTVIEDFGTRDLSDYRVTRDGGGEFRIVNDSMFVSHSALELETGPRSTHLTSNDELVEIGPDTTIKGDIRHETDNSRSFAMRTGFIVGGDSDGSDGIRVRLANPGFRVSQGAYLYTPNNASRIAFTPERGEFYTFRIDVGDGTVDPKLRDSNGDGIPDVIAEMNPRMTVGGPDMVGSPIRLDPLVNDTSGDGRPDGEVIDIAWEVYEDVEGVLHVGAEIVDALYRPDTGEEVTREVIKIGYFLPTEASVEDEDPLTTLTIGDERKDGYVLTAADDDIPGERDRHGWWWIFNSDPIWLPDNLVDKDWYHMKLEPVIVVQYTHDVRTEDLPEKYKIDFTGFNQHVYGGEREFVHDKGYVTEELIVAGPTGLSELFDEAGSSIEESELTIDMTGTSFGEKEVIARSEHEYFYNTDIVERYERVYDEAMTVFQEGMTASASLTTAPTRWTAMRAADSMTERNLIRAIGNAEKIQKVVDGTEDTGYDDMQSDIYEAFDVVEDETVVVGTGPVIAIDLNSRKELVEE